MIQSSARNSSVADLTMHRTSGNFDSAIREGVAPWELGTVMTNGLGSKRFGCWVS